MKGENFSKKQVMQDIYPLIENTCVRFDLIPIEVDFLKENGRWFLRIFIYSTKREVTLADCENITRSISDFLDELIPVKYNLEVSSPGLERRLKSHREYIIYSGKVIDLKLKNPLEQDGEKHFKAIIKGFSESDGVSVERLSDGKKFTFPFSEVISARLCFEENEKQFNKEKKHD